MSEDTWTLSELVAEAADRIGALPAPKNGQVRAVPDERTVRYYGTLGLLDRPSGHRGRTALYGKKHLAQIVAIKRLQAADKTIAEITALWPTLDAATLARMSGVPLPREARPEFWKRAPAAVPTVALPPEVVATASETPTQIRVTLAPGVTLLVTLQLERTETTP